MKKESGKLQESPDRNICRGFVLIYFSQKLKISSSITLLLLQVSKVPEVLKLIPSVVVAVVFRISIAVNSKGSGKL